MTPISGTTQEVESIASMMNSYGPVIVVLSVFLMLFIVIMLFMLKQHQGSQDRLMKENQMLIQNLLENQLRKELDKSQQESAHDPKSIIQEHLRISNAMRVTTSTYISLLKSSRVAIYALHNGVTSLTGLSFLKFSCISEYVSNPMNAHIKHHTNFPVNFMCDLLEDLVEHREVAFYDETNLAISPNKILVDMLLANTSNKYVFRGIFDTSSTLIAFIVCEFDSQDIDSSNYKEKSSLIDELISRISPILEYSNFSDTYSKVVQKNETQGV